MGAVRYRCPSTGEEVETAIETSSETLVKMQSMHLAIWVWCPHCMAGHQIAPCEAILDASPLDRVNGDNAIPEGAPQEAAATEAPATEAPATVPIAAVPNQAIPIEAILAKTLPAKTLPAKTLPTKTLPTKTLPAEALSGEGPSRETLAFPRRSFQQAAHQRSLGARFAFDVRDSLDDGDSLARSAPFQDAAAKDMIGPRPAAH